VKALDQKYGEEELLVYIAFKNQSALSPAS